MQLKSKTELVAFIGNLLLGQCFSQLRAVLPITGTKTFNILYLPLLSLFLLDDIESIKIGY